MLWSPTGKATVLQSFGRFSAVAAINDAGWSVGLSGAASNKSDAVLWSPTGKAIVLPDVGGQGSSAALAINDAGQSVGTSETAGGGDDAVLWSPSGKATNLAALLGPAWSDTRATGINNSGDIVGSGEYHGDMTSFLLMHVCGASSDDYHAVISHDGTAALAAVHDHLRS